MRTLVDIADADVKALDEISAKAGQSRAALIRRAITDYLGKSREQTATEAFGLWGKRQTDGLVYQREVRREW